jgi:hypothetical protein
MAMPLGAEAAQKALAQLVLDPVLIDEGSYVIPDREIQ